MTRKSHQPDAASLIGAARVATRTSHSPYSRFTVGAALLDDRHRVFAGCNVENASYGLTVCAERVAIFKAVSEGSKKIVALAVTASTHESGYVPTSPCGACLQVLAEFADGDTLIFVDGRTAQRLSDLLPRPFKVPAELTVIA